MLEDDHFCPHCGGRLYHRRRTMTVDPEAPGPLELICRWFAGEFTVLGAIAITGFCVLLVLIGLGLALSGS